MRKMLPRSAWSDFQDLPQWRSAVIANLATAARVTDGPVVVPMTLVNESYFDEIMSGLRAASIEARHFALTASPATIRRRLRSRSGFWLARAQGAGESWAEQQIHRCVTALETDRFSEHIATDHLTVAEVAETVASRLGVSMSAPRLGPLASQARRLTIGLQHIRW